MARECRAHQRGSPSLGTPETRGDCLFPQPRKPLLQPMPTFRPLGRNDREHSRVPQLALFACRPRLGPISQDALEPCAKRFDRSSRPYVTRVRLQIDSNNAPLFERMAKQQQLCLRIDSSALSRHSKPRETDLDGAQLRSARPQPRVPIRGGADCPAR